MQDTTPADTPEVDNGGDGTQAREQAAHESPADAGTKDTTPADTPEVDNGGDDANGDMFPRKVVEQLRAEAAAARVKAKEADTLRRDLFTARVERDGRLHDASDMPYNAELLEDSDALAAAIDDLLERKPYLAKRPTGDIGAGARGGAGTTVDLIGAIKQAQEQRR